MSSLFKKKNNKPNAIKAEVKVKEPYKSLEGDTLKKLSGRDLSFAEYPTYLYFDDDRFKLRSLKGLDVVNPVALKELRVNKNKLKELHGDLLNRFIKLKRIDASQNHLQNVEELNLEKLVELNLNSNQLTSVPDLNECTALEDLRLSLNVVTANRKMFESLERCTKLKTLELNKNNLKMQPYDFVKAMESLGKHCTKLHTLDLRDNKLHVDVPDYRTHVAQKIPSLKILDGEPVTSKERKKKVDPIKKHQGADDDGESVAEGSSSGAGVGGGDDESGDEAGEVVEGDDEEFAEGEVGASGGKGTGRRKGKGAVSTVKFSELMQLLLDAFSRPDEGLDRMDQLEDKVVRFVNLPVEKRHMNYDQQDAKTSVEEFITSTVELMEGYASMTTVATRVLLRLMMVRENKNPLGAACERQVMEFVEAGNFHEAIRKGLQTVVVHDGLVNNKLMSEEERDTLLAFLRRVSDTLDLGDLLLPVVQLLAELVSKEEPSDDVVGLVKAAARNKACAIELTTADMAGKVSMILDQEEQRSVKSARFLDLIGIVEHQSRNDPEATQQYVDTEIHLRLLNYCNEQMSLLTEDWTAEDSMWLSHIIGTMDGLCANSPDALVTILNSNYLEQLLSIISDHNVHHKLLSRALHSILQFLHLTPDVPVHQKIADGVGYMVPLLEYIDGKGYDRLCKETGAVDKAGEPVPLVDLKNTDMYEVLVEIVALIAYYAAEAVRMQPVACSVCDALDTAGRERYLFGLLTVPDDDIKLTTVNCLKNVPKDNLQASEVKDIVRILQDVRDVSSGRTEEVLAVVLEVLQGLAVSRGEEGISFRENHVDTVLIVLDLLERNEARDTSDSEDESDEKAALSGACVSYLLACSGWPDAVEAMQSEDAVTRMCNVLRLEDYFGSEERPVFLERTALGNGIKGLLDVLPKLRPDGHVAGRVMNRMAEVLEGRYGGPPTEDEDNQESKIWFKKSLQMETASEREFREQQIETFMRRDALNLLVDFLRGEEALLEGSAGGAADEEGDSDHSDDSDDSDDEEIAVYETVDAEGSSSSSAAAAAAAAAAAHDMGGRGRYAPRNLASMVQKTQEETQRSVEERKKEEEEAKNKKKESKEVDEDEEARRRQKKAMEETRAKLLVMEVGEPEFSVLDDDDLGHFEMPAGKLKLGKIKLNAMSLALPRSSESLSTAATMRIVLALLWYSDSREVARYVRGRLLESNAIQLFAQRVRASHWYNHNAAARFLDVAYELFRMDHTQATNNMLHLNLYDIVCQMMTDVIKSIDDHLNEGLCLTTRQELVVHNACKLWSLILVQVGYIFFDAKEMEVNHACHKYLFFHLLPIEALNMCIRYLFYHESTNSKMIESMRKTDGSRLDSTHLFHVRDRAAQQATRMVAEYTEVQDNVRYEVLEHFNRLEVLERISLHESHLARMLQMMEERTFTRALEGYMQQKEMTVDGHFERVLKQKWVAHVSGSSSTPRLLVLTNKRMYVMNEPAGKKCTVCGPEKFCPDGPKLKNAVEYEAVQQLVLGYSNYRFVIKTGKPKRTWVLGAEQLGDAEEFCALLSSLSTEPVAEDHAFSKAIIDTFVNKENVARVITQQMGAEIVLLCTPGIKTNAHGSKQNRVFVLTKGHIHNFKESLGNWGNSKKDVKTLEHSSMYALREVSRVTLDEELPRMTVFFGLAEDAKSKVVQFDIEFADAFLFGLWVRTLREQLPPGAFSKFGLSRDYYVKLEEEMAKQEEEELLRKGVAIKEANRGKGKAKA